MGNEILAQLIQEGRSEKYTERILRSKNLHDTTSPKFGESCWSRRIQDPEGKEMPVVSILAIPPALDSIPDIEIGVLNEWLKSQERKYPPRTEDRLFSFQRSRPTSNAILYEDFFDDEKDVVNRYLLTHFDGTIELSLGREGSYTSKVHRAFRMLPILFRCWTFMEFVDDLYSNVLHTTGSYNFYLNLAQTQGTFLSNFANGWPEHHVWPGRRTCCCEENVQLHFTFPIGTTPEEREASLHRLARRLDGAWGHISAEGNPRCYFPDSKGAPVFDLNTALRSIY